MGASPGVTNLLGKLIADDFLDETDSIDIFHTHGGEPMEGEGVIGHRFHCMSIEIPMFLDGKLTRLPVEPWATEAIEIPGQVWCPSHINRQDVEPHPLSELVPSNGLIGCFTKDEKMIMATAWQPDLERVTAARIPVGK